MLPNHQLLTQGCLLYAQSKYVCLQRMSKDYVILVDEFDNELGTAEKLQAHQEAKLHRAISVFVFNHQKEWLLQKRATNKYHSPGLWSNTCCSHPRPGEDVARAATRRLMEEMGINCPLKFSFSFTYKAALENNLTEHEFDYVFIGFTDNFPKPDPKEVSEYLYISTEEIEQRMKQNKEQFTPWFKLIFERVKTELNNIKQTI